MFVSIRVPNHPEYTEYVSQIGPTRMTSRFLKSILLSAQFNLQIAVHEKLNNIILIDFYNNEREDTPLFTYAIMRFPYDENYDNYCVFLPNGELWRSMKVPF